MFGTQNGLPICSDIAVDKHQYHVLATFTDDGGTCAEEIIEAGSAAHAAMLVGILIYLKHDVYFTLEGDPFGKAFANFAHNMGEHIIVDVQLIG